MIWVFIFLSQVLSTFNNAKQLKEVTKRLPLERLLIETDSPYLAPVPYRGQQNEPQYLPQVAECVAALKNISVAKLAEHTSNNFYALFKPNNGY